MKYIVPNSVLFEPKFLSGSERLRSVRSPGARFFLPLIFNSGNSLDNPKILKIPSWFCKTNDPSNEELQGKCR